MRQAASANCWHASNTQAPVPGLKIVCPPPSNSGPRAGTVYGLSLSHPATKPRILIFSFPYYDGGELLLDSLSR